MLVSFIFLIKGKQYPTNYSEAEIAKLPEAYKLFISDRVIGLTDNSLAGNLANILSERISKFRATLKPNNIRRLRDCIKTTTVNSDLFLVSS